MNKNNKYRILLALALECIIGIFPSYAAANYLQPDTCPTEGFFDICYEIHAVYDVGSSNTKFKTTLVDICNNKVVGELTENKREPVSYAEDTKNNHNTFSEEIQMKGISIFNEFSDATKQLTLKNNYPYKLREYGVATAAFRKAANAREYADKIKDTIGIDLEVISQAKEGILAFYGAVAKTETDPKNAIVWDIGGGSMQFTFINNDNEIESKGNGIAGNTFRNMVIQEIKNGKLSPNPMTEDEVEQAIELAISKLENLNITINMVKTA